jgi:hypothetical protein
MLRFNGTTCRSSRSDMMTVNMDRPACGHSRRLRRNFALPFVSFRRSPVIGHQPYQALKPCSICEFFTNICRFFRLRFLVAFLLDVVNLSEIAGRAHSPRSEKSQLEIDRTHRTGITCRLQGDICRENYNADENIRDYRAYCVW